MNNEEVIVPEVVDDSPKQSAARPHVGMGAIDHSSVPFTRNTKPRRMSGAQTVKRKIPKMGRNALCPCGSGKKIKKCECKFAPLCM